MAAGIKAPKKLTEVALPLDDINSEGAAEKLANGHGDQRHPGP